ncbi:kinase-like domain-containing protein [Colletotrichum navitas]|uniref:Kinase-like domain-containing protein n=1 Tax=Colletotrichum navitas TaxID=681940 RepID=A0AAD8PS89_9PEZI|nr:kinase-like domain-containing protein [Colletotrichum navitas]KAK1579784.1 kinase-like domain-containing protein [Colletotrichum navitas]
MGNSQGKPIDLDGEVNLNHFRLLRVVGRGAFGKVRIVERKDTNLSFALKYIRKDEVVRSESVRNIIRERRMLEHVNHPFICNLRYSFQDIEYMYLVVDLMSGGDLRFHISRKTFTEDAVRFWIAELGCALRYIHSQNIIHRDVKPDNVLLDADGHVHLTDFNVASDIIPGKVLSSKSGTLAYLAPEVYAGKGYDVRADWWSLGVLFYECIYNKRPFDGNSESTLSQQIQLANPKYPITSPPVSLPCLYAIRDALDVNRDKRMGSTWESFTKHEFFMMIDFEALERKEIEPVFVPAADKTNFDATYDLEELLLEEAPLEARARRQKPRERLKEDASDKEIREDELYRMIENEFRPFDYTLAAYKKYGPAPSFPSAPRTDTFRITGQVDESGYVNGDMVMMNQPQALTTDEATPVAMATNGGSSKAAQPPGPIRKSSSLEKAPGSGQAGVPRRPISKPPPIPHYPSQYSTQKSMPPGAGQRVTSPTGGMQVTLDGGGSWSDLARQDATLPTDANTISESKSESSGGVFGFLRGKKGRGHSPKPKERGVLGKEGARQVIG